MLLVLILLKSFYVWYHKLSKKIVIMMSKMSEKIPELFVFTKKTVFMQRIADLVRTDHVNYASGEIPLRKLDSLYKKFAKFYNCHFGKLEASRYRKKGYASARFLAYLPEDSDKAHWILLVSYGDFEFAELGKLEKWRDALKDRINLTGYELVRITKPTEPKPVWTWRYIKSREQELRDAIVSAIRHRQELALSQLINTVWRSPGFAGVRDQVKKMGNLIKEEWKRSRTATEQMPEIPQRIGYVQRLPDKGKYIKAILKERNAGE